MKVSVTESKYSEYQRGFCNNMLPGDVGISAKGTVVIAVENGEAVQFHSGGAGMQVQSLRNLRKLELRKPIDGLTIVIRFSKEDLYKGSG